jgi:ABC-type multidrug transport system ATPase subunit
MKSLLEVRDLSKNFGTFEAVKNLSFTVNEGDVYGFLGQNGAGKSTTLRMLLKLITPSTGNFYFSEKKLKLATIACSKILEPLLNAPIYTNTYLPTTICTFLPK